MNKCAWIAACCAAVLVVGCSAGTDGDSSAPTTIDSDLSRELLTDMAAVTDRTISESGIVVVARVIAVREIPGNARSDGSPVPEESREYVAATAATVQIDRVLLGKIDTGDRVQIRQLGLPNLVYRELPKLRTDSTYLLFLVPHRYAAGPSGYWQIVGQDAAWLRSDSGHFELAAPDNGTRYPTQLSEESVEQMLTATR